MDHGGHRKRMRERFETNGLEGFAPHEVLELMLFYAIPQKNVNPLGHELVNRFGSLHGVLEAEPQMLRQVNGIGEYAATFISLFAQVNKYAELERLGERAALSSRKTASEYCQKLLMGERRELFYVICLNGQMEVLKSVLIAKGSLSNVPAYPRLVAEAALNHNAHSVLLCHNHPGGSIVPSQGDMEVTRQLSALLAGLEIVLVDHMIVAGDRTLSMVAHRLIEQEVSPLGVSTRVADPAGETRIRQELKKRAAMGQALKEEPLEET